MAHTFFLDYKRKTGKLSKKEAKMTASTNRSMKDWVRKVDTPSKSIPENTD